MGKDSAARIELGRSFHQMGTDGFVLCLLLLGLLLMLLDYPFGYCSVIKAKTHACPRITLVTCPCHICLLLFDAACDLTVY